MRHAHQQTIYEVLGRSSVHPFPARMAPGIALEALIPTRTPLRILDPMMGSGTVLALARANGHRALGIDIDPLAVLISKVWTTAVDREKIRHKAVEVFRKARDDFSEVRLSAAYPLNSDRETRKFVRYWFDSYVRRQLTALSRAIRRVRDRLTRDVLWCAFSRLIITKQAGASLAKDLAHSRPHKSFKLAPIKPLAHFLVAVDRVLENCISITSENRGPATIVREGDARGLLIADNSIDLVLTSPPYLNAIDYMRCSKFSLIWMGYTAESIRNLRSSSIGTEVGRYNQDRYSTAILKSLKLDKRLSRRHQAVLSQYIEDMRTAVCEVSRVLVPGGKAIYVLGDNTVRGTYIRNSRIVQAIAARAGLKLEAQRMRSLPPNRRYLPPPTQRKRRAALDTRMRYEVVLSFRKPNSRRQRKNEISA